MDSVGSEAAWRREIDGVTVTAHGIPDMTESEARGYVAYVMERVLERAPDPVARIDIYPAKDDKVELQYETRHRKFERIRRITG